MQSRPWMSVHQEPQGGRVSCPAEAASSIASCPAGPHKLPVRSLGAGSTSWGQGPGGGCGWTGRLMLMWPQLSNEA